MKFVRRWYLGQGGSDMETIEDRIIKDFNCFTFKWSACDDTDRRSWSADTRFHAAIHW